MLSIVTLVGTVLVRPELVLPFALGFVEPLLAEPQKAPSGNVEVATPQPAKSAPTQQVAATVGATPDAGLSAAESPSSGASTGTLGKDALAPEAVPKATVELPTTTSGDTRRTITLIAEADPVKPGADADSSGKTDAPASDEQSSGSGKEKQIEPTLGSLTPKPSLVPEEFYAGGSKIVSAKNLFGSAKSASPLAARSIGFYAKGCLSGAVALPIDGAAWQAMRVARNRNWGHPDLIKLIEQLGKDAKEHDGWNGLLVGDISQPRGGPMLSGHASHQVGLDADIWLTPMPDHTLTTVERDNMPATSMLDSTDAAVDPKVFTDKQVALIKRAALYPDVERIFVHPAIKKALCLAAGTDRKWLTKVRQIPGHFYHFHVRIKCPPGFTGCQGQPPVTGDEGCGKDLDKWLERIKTASKAPAAPPAPPKPPVPGKAAKLPPPPMMLSQLPKECAAILESGDNPVAIPKEALGPPPTPPKPKPAVAVAAQAKGAAALVPIPAAAPAAATVAPAAAAKVTLKPIKERLAKPQSP